MFGSSVDAEMTAPTKPSMRVLKDRTNRLAAIDNRVEKKPQSSGNLQSRSGFMRDSENRFGNQGKVSLYNQSQKSLQRQGSKSSLSSSSSKQSDCRNENVTIEEIRVSSNGSKTVHKYLRGRLLGKGGFAKVYMCTSLDTQKNYAVKIVPKANLVKSRARQKLQAEIKIHRTLKHRRICEFKHFFEDRKNCYILLELCPNQTLNELLKRRKRLTELEVMYFMHQLIEGVQYIHSCNVIHRDLKLGNLFLDTNMGVKIGDLGLAVKLGKADEKRTTICGTPNYIAPEVIDCLNGGKRGHSFEVDVWAMGVIMYATLVGKPPYEAKDVKSTYKRILNNEYSFPAKIQISDHAKHLITGMLQSNPETRPTLGQVIDHPFFRNTQGCLPASLPSKCARSAPIWRKDENGNYVVEFPHNEAENLPPRNFSVEKGPQHVVPSKPFTSLNPNILKPKQDEIDGTKPVQTNIRGNEEHQRFIFGRLNSIGNENKKMPLANANQSNGMKTSQPKFAIFSDKPETQQKERPMEDMVSNVANMQIAMPTSAQNFGMKTDTAFSSNEFEAGNPQIVPALEKKPTLHQPLRIKDSMEESNSVPLKPPDALETMHNRLERSFNMKTQVQDMDAEMQGPKMECSPVWVSRYVDYTSKYGLGFLLNDGSSGVYFNDSTKIVLAPEGDIFQYIERRKTTSNQKVPDQEVEPTVHIYSLTTFPTHLQKKVTLLQHFRNYLVEQQKESGDLMAAKPQRKKAEAESSANSISPYVYLKKWVRTRHAILFRLSNCTVQVVFYDHTEVLLSSEARLVTYVDKGGLRTTYPIHEITKNPNGEVGKRLKYAKDILQQLISGAK